MGNIVCRVLDIEVLGPNLRRKEHSFMKQVAILVLFAIMLNGCGTTSNPVQTAAGGTWEAQMLGGEGSSSGFSFTTQFTVGGAGALSISYFQFINESACFPFNGER